MTSGGNIFQTLKKVATTAFAAPTQEPFDIASLVVRDYQQEKMNEHLNHAVEQFDDGYSKYAGELGTPEHLEERKRFAEFLAHQLVNLQQNDPSYIMQLHSQVEHTTANGVMIGVWQQDTWDGTRPEAKFQP